MDWLRDNAALIIGFFGMVGVLWTGWVKLRGDDDEDEAKLRGDLLKTVNDLSSDARNLRDEIRAMRTAHKTDIAAVRDEADTERRALEAEASKQITALQTRLDHLDETNRRLNRQVTTMGQQIVEMQGAVKGLQDREYVYVAHYHELDRQGMVLYPYEWTRIKQAANRIQPMPLWPVSDALDSPQEEGPTTNE